MKILFTAYFATPLSLYFTTDLVLHCICRVFRSRVNVILPLIRIPRTNTVLISLGQVYSTKSYYVKYLWCTCFTWIFSFFLVMYFLPHVTTNIFRITHFYVWISSLVRFQYYFTKTEFRIMKRYNWLKFLWSDEYYF